MTLIRWWHDDVIFAPRKICFTLSYLSFKILITNFLVLQVPSYVMLGIPKHEDAPPTPQHPLSPMGEACSRMDLTAIHQILVMTHYRDDEGTNEVIGPWMKFHFLSFCFSFSLSFFLGICIPLNLKFRGLCWLYIGSVVLPRMDPTDERYAGSKEARGLCIP